MVRFDEVQMFTYQYIRDFNDPITLLEMVNLGVISLKNSP